MAIHGLLATHRPTPEKIQWTVGKEKEKWIRYIYKGHVLGADGQDINKENNKIHNGKKQLFAFKFSNHKRQ